MRAVALGERPPDISGIVATVPVCVQPPSEVEGAVAVVEEHHSACGVEGVRLKEAVGLQTGRNTVQCGNWRPESRRRLFNVVVGFVVQHEHPTTRFLADLVEERQELGAILQMQAEVQHAAAQFRPERKGRGQFDRWPAGAAPCGKVHQQAAARNPGKDKVPLLRPVIQNVERAASSSVRSAVLRHDVPVPLDETVAMPSLRCAGQQTP